MLSPWGALASDAQSTKAREQKLKGFGLSLQLQLVLAVPNSLPPSFQTTCPCVDSKSQPQTRGKDLCRGPLTRPHTCERPDPGHKPFLSLLPSCEVSTYQLSIHLYSIDVVSCLSSILSPSITCLPTTTHFYPSAVYLSFVCLSSILPVVPHLYWSPNTCERWAAPQVWRSFTEAAWGRARASVTGQGTVTSASFVTGAMPRTLIERVIFCHKVRDTNHPKLLCLKQGSFVGTDSRDWLACARLGSVALLRG